MNEVLDHRGEDVAPRIVGSMYEWRARANAALRNYKDAYADLQEYVTRYTAANNAERIRQAGALRARFETDREIERNFSLKRELENTQEQSNRQAQAAALEYRGRGGGRLRSSRCSFTSLSRTAATACSSCSSQARTP